uniref:Uncharacterized protein n=1 Tax=Zea mays TaxID=4577 RepID=B7ZZ97_MAIZE|nr:unknown [Zea mays]
MHGTIHSLRGGIFNTHPIQPQSSENLRNIRVLFYFAFFSFPNSNPYKHIHTHIYATSTKA